MTQIRLPEISGTQEEQLRQLQNYLFQLASQLQFAFDSLEGSQTPAPAPAEKTPAQTFSEIKSLIVKSADVVQSVSEKVERSLSGQYVAQSDYGTFTRQTQQQIAEHDSGIERLFSEFQQVQSLVTGVESQLLETQAYIRTGLLYEQADGVSVYGVEIGQQDYRDGALIFRKFARLASDRLSFFDSNDQEVAYISDRQLHVTAAQIHSLAASEISAQRLHMGSYSWTAGRDGHLTLS